MRILNGGRNTSGIYLFMPPNKQKKEKKTKSKTHNPGTVTSVSEKAELPIMCADLT